jgi:hypothetical protein
MQLWGTCTWLRVLSRSSGVIPLEVVLEVGTGHWIPLEAQLKGGRSTYHLLAPLVRSLKSLRDLQGTTWPPPIHVPTTPLERMLASDRVCRRGPGATVCGSYEKRTTAHTKMVLASTGTDATRSWMEHDTQQVCWSPTLRPVPSLGSLSLGGVLLLLMPLYPSSSAAAVAVAEPFGLLGLMLVLCIQPFALKRLLSLLTHRCTQPIHRRWAFPVQGAAIISSAYGPRHDPFIADWYRLTPSTTLSHDATLGFAMLLELTIVTYVNGTRAASSFTAGSTWRPTREPLCWRRRRAR